MLKIQVLYEVVQQWNIFHLLWEDSVPTHAGLKMNKTHMLHFLQT